MPLSDERRALLDAAFAPAAAELFAERGRDSPPRAVLWVHPPWHAHGPGLDDLGARYGGTLVVVDGQALRSTLPDYDQAMLHPLTAQEATREDVGYLVQRGMEYAREHGISVLVPGTGTRPGVTLGTAQEFAAADGFSVDLVAVAEPMEETRLSAVFGYFDPDDAARVWPRPENRRANWDGLAETIAQAVESPDVARVVVMTRDGEVLSDSDLPGAPDALATFEAARQLDYSPEQAHVWLARWQQVLDWAHASGQLNDPMIAPVLAELTEDAVRVAALADERSGGGGGPDSALRRVDATVRATHEPTLITPLISWAASGVAAARTTLARATDAYAQATMTRLDRIVQYVTAAGGPGSAALVDRLREDGDAMIRTLDARRTTSTAAIDRDLERLRDSRTT